MESCSIINDGNGILAQGEEEVRRIWKKYFEDLYDIDTQEQITVPMCGFDGIRRYNCFGGKLFGRGEVEVRVRKLKNGKSTGRDEITGEMVKGRGDKVVD